MRKALNKQYMLLTPQKVTFYFVSNLAVLVSVPAEDLSQSVPSSLSTVQEYLSESTSLYMYIVLLLLVE